MSTLIKALAKSRNKEKSDSSRLINKGRIPVSKGKGPERSPKVKTTKPIKSEENRKVEVSYSKTQVQEHDLEKLKDNQIFSIFDDVEATNEMKLLRTKILKKMKVISGNSLMVTSANSYEGKTFTSINLGISIAKEFDRTVLIVDADLRKPNNKHCAFSQDFFELRVNKGLSDFLSGDADIPDILINPGIAKLTLIPSGLPVDNAPELLNSSRMQTMMEELTKRYPDRFVIIDTPPMSQYADAIILSRFVDGVLVVVETEKTSNDALKKMVNDLKGANILGTLLNKNKG